MDKGLISIIIPVYNVEKYVERCVESVLNQSYKDIEIILVDDGSTDQSGKICDEYAANFRNITTVHQNNQGLGPARNTGLERIKGEYVAFIDSDDWVEANAYETMHKKMLEHGCDIVTCGRSIVTDAKVVDHLYCLDTEMVLNKEEAIQHYLLQKDMNMSACDKLFLSNLFEDVRFPGDHLVSEDIVPLYQVLKKSHGVCLSGLPLYNYYYRVGSLSKSKFNVKLMGPLYYSKEVASKVYEDFPTLSDEADYFELDFMISTYRSIRRSMYKGIEEETVHNDLKCNLKKAFRNRSLSIRQKVYVILAVLRIDRLPDYVYRKFKNRRLA